MHFYLPLAVAYQQIDWHDFVVVETLEFTVLDFGMPANLLRPQLD